jgi:hypothetical protein
VNRVTRALRGARHHRIGQALLARDRSYMLGSVAHAMNISAAQDHVDPPRPEISDARMNQAADPQSKPPGVPPVNQDTAQRFELPMLKRYPVIAGAVAGLLLRLAFSGPAGSPWSAMAGWFIYLAPIVVGMVTVYLAERERRRSWAYYAVAPLFATALFVIGTLLLLIEGLICAIVIVPMFATMGAIGGLVMGAICRATRWPRHTVYSVASLPLLLAWLGAGLPEPSLVGQIERSVLIEAPAEVVWRQINRIDSISKEDMSEALASRIGVPMPLSGSTEIRPEGRVRVSHWGKQVYFEEVVEDWQPHRYLRWSYRFHEDSFPRRALDDHVVMGGHYFDLIDTSYTLSEENGSTRLHTATRYRISTHFNFYADWVAQLLLGNLSETGLRLYRSRSEAEVGRAPDTPPYPDGGP